MPMTTPAGGDETLPGLLPGDYTIYWADVEGWDAPVPDPETLPVTDATTTTFAGTYVAVSGVIALDLTNIAGSDSGYVRIPNSPGLEPAQLTLEAWITPLGNGTGSDDGLLGAALVGMPLEGGSDVEGASFYLAWSPTHQAITFLIANDINVDGRWLMSPIMSAPVGYPFHVAATFDGATMSIYINAMLMAAVPTASPDIDYQGFGRVDRRWKLQPAGPVPVRRYHRRSTYLGPRPLGTGHRRHDGLPANGVGSGAPRLLEF